MIVAIDLSPSKCADQLVAARSGVQHDLGREMPELVRRQADAEMAPGDLADLLGNGARAPGPSRVIHAREDETVWHLASAAAVHARHRAARARRSGRTTGAPARPGSSSPRVVRQAPACRSGRPGRVTWRSKRKPAILLIRIGARSSSRNSRAVWIVRSVAPGPRLGRLMSASSVERQRHQLQLGLLGGKAAQHGTVLRGQAMIRRRALAWQSPAIP